MKPARLTSFSWARASSTPLQGEQVEGGGRFARRRRHGGRGAGNTRRRIPEPVEARGGVSARASAAQTVPGARAPARSGGRSGSRAVRTTQTPGTRRASIMAAAAARTSVAQPGPPQTPQFGPRTLNSWLIVPDGEWRERCGGRCGDAPQAPSALVAVQAGGDGGPAHVVGRGQDGPGTEGGEGEAVAVGGVGDGGDGGDGLLVGLFQGVDRQRGVEPRAGLAAQLRHRPSIGTRTHAWAATSQATVRGGADGG